jgi:hypothetical protein
LDECGYHGVEIIDECLLASDLAKVEAEAVAFVLVESVGREKLVEPAAAFRAEEVRELVLDEIAMKDRVDLVLELCLIADEALSVSRKFRSRSVSRSGCQTSGR